jgi:hypothetical protein
VSIGRGESVRARVRVRVRKEGRIEKSTLIGCRKAKAT